MADNLDLPFPEVEEASFNASVMEGPFIQTADTAPVLQRYDLRIGTLIKRFPREKKRGKDRYANTRRPNKAHDQKRDSSGRVRKSGSGSVRKSSLLDGRSRGTKDLAAALPVVDESRRISKKSRTAASLLGRKRRVAQVPEIPFWMTDLCLLMDCGRKLPHLHTKEEVTLALGWTPTSIQLFSEHSSSFLAHGELFHTCCGLAKPKVNSKSIETEIQPDLQWKPCNMLDDFAESTIDMRRTLPVVAEVNWARHLGQGRTSPASLEEACLKSQRSVDLYGGVRVQSFIGPVQRSRSQRQGIKSSRNPYLGLTRVTDQLGDLDIGQNTRSSDTHQEGDRRLS